MEGQKDAASEVMEIAVTVSDALDDFDRVVEALGEAVGVRTGKGIENEGFPVLQHGKAGGKLGDIRSEGKQTESAQTFLGLHRVFRGHKRIEFLFDKQICTIGCFDTPMSPYMFEYDKENYVVYRKTLFGYSLINLDTLDEHNCYPEEGINGEAYIAVQVIHFRDILIFDGCYWGCPYGYLFAQLGTDHTFSFSNSFGEGNYFKSSDSKQPIIKDDSVILFNSDGERKELLYSEIMKMF